MCRCLAIFGELDWYEDRASVDLIGSIVNRETPGRAEVHIIPGLDHHFTRYRSRAAAFSGDGGEPDANAAMEVLLPWLSRHAE